MTWVNDTQYLMVPKGLSAEKLAVVLDMMKFLLQPEQQALTYDKGYFYPGPAVKNVPASMAPQASQDVLKEYGRPEYEAWFAQNPQTQPLDAKPLVEAFPSLGPGNRRAEDEIGDGAGDCNRCGGRKPPRSHQTGDISLKPFQNTVVHVRRALLGAAGGIARRRFSLSPYPPWRRPPRSRSHRRRGGQSRAHAGRDRGVSEEAPGSHRQDQFHQGAFAGASGQAEGNAGRGSQRHRHGADRHRFSRRRIEQGVLMKVLPDYGREIPKPDRELSARCGEDAGACAGITV